MAKNKKFNNISKEAQEKLSETIAIDNEIVDIDLKDVSEGTVKIDDSTLVRVKSNTFGELIYINQKSGEETRWGICGEVQVMTVGDLRAMKNNQSAFFSNQWIVILGAEDENSEIKPADFYKHLGIIRYYQNLIEPSDFTTICSWSEQEIESKIALMSDSARHNLMVALNEYIKTGILDSSKQIKAFEKALGCKLAEAE